jgi:hypothetical protein
MLPPELPVPSIGGSGHIILINISKSIILLTLVITEFMLSLINSLFLIYCVNLQCTICVYINTLNL